MDEAPIVCVDFDGVLNQFDGWRGPDFLHPPRPEALAFLTELNRLGSRVVVFTVRWAPDVQRWLAEHGLAEHVVEVTDKKPPAHVYIDDRAICFQGDFQATLEQVARFKAHWEVKR